jgi:hypothetical protein
VEDALAHVYLEPYHDVNDEPGSVPLKPEFFNFTLPNMADGKDDPRMNEMMKREWDLRVSFQHRDDRIAFHRSIQHPIRNGKRLPLLFETWGACLELIRRHSALTIELLHISREMKDPRWLPGLVYNEILKPNHY